MSHLPDQLSASPQLQEATGCPYLGLVEDPQTCLAYPSEWNLCHHVKQPFAVDLEHQRITCLLPAHIDCPVFQSAGQDNLPTHLRWRRMPLGARKILFLAALIVIVLAIAGWGIFWAK